MFRNLVRLQPQRFCKAKAFIILASLLITLGATPPLRASPLAQRTHTVQPGETLSQIAERYQVAVEQLMELNDIAQANAIFVDQVLTLPDENAPTPTPTPVVYIVQAGDLLSQIAERYGVTVKALIEANQLANASAIFWGQRLLIPSTTPTAEDTPSPSATPSQTATPKATAQATPSATSSATPSAALATLEPTIHIVQAGETASGIAEGYGISLGELLNANALDSPDTIVVGQQLIIPAAAVVETTTETAEASDSSTGSNEDARGPAPNRRIASLNRVYKVFYANDTPNYIALRTGVDPGALVALNNLSSGRMFLEVGSELLLPATDRELYVRPNVPPGNLYTVQTGDAPEAIADAYGLTLGDLLYANRIGNPDSIEAGQELVIPEKNADGVLQQHSPPVGPGRRGFFFYTVRAGDTASELAEKLNTNENAIIDYNDFPNLDTVILGMEIRVPYGPPRLPIAQPPTPISGTSFVVSISRQQCWVFWGKNVARAWRCSTGRGDNKTRLGNFKVQSKIEMAESRAYQLDMPYWLGIYNAGAYENGIHGLPIDQWKKKKIWTELVGQPATFGCAMLNDENAAELFNMAYIGMPVYVIR
jgi:LysM repeat protein